MGSRSGAGAGYLEKAAAKKEEARLKEEAAEKVKAEFEAAASSALAEAVAAGKRLTVAMKAGPAAADTVAGLKRELMLKKTASEIAANRARPVAEQRSSNADVLVNISGKLKQELVHCLRSSSEPKPYCPCVLHLTVTQTLTGKQSVNWLAQFNNKAAHAIKEAYVRNIAIQLLTNPSSVVVPSAEDALESTLKFISGAHGEDVFGAIRAAKSDDEAAELLRVFAKSRYQVKGTSSSKAAAAASEAKFVFPTMADLEIGLEPGEKDRLLEGPSGRKVGSHRIPRGDGAGAGGERGGPGGAAQLDGGRRGSRLGHAPAGGAGHAGGGADGPSVSGSRGAAQPSAAAGGEGITAPHQESAAAAAAHAAPGEGGGGGNQGAGSLPSEGPFGGRGGLEAGEDEDGSLTSSGGGTLVERGRGAPPGPSAAEAAAAAARTCPFPVRQGSAALPTQPLPPPPLPRARPHGMGTAGATASGLLPASIRPRRRRLRDGSDGEEGEEGGGGGQGGGGCLVAGLEGAGDDGGGQEAGEDEDGTLTASGGGTLVERGRGAPPGPSAAAAAAAATEVGDKRGSAFLDGSQSPPGAQKKKALHPPLAAGSLPWQISTVRRLHSFVHAPTGTRVGIRLPEHGSVEGVMFATARAAVAAGALAEVDQPGPADASKPVCIFQRRLHFVKPGYRENAITVLGAVHAPAPGASVNGTDAAMAEAGLALPPGATGGRPAALLSGPPLPPAAAGLVPAADAATLPNSLTLLPTAGGAAVLGGPTSGPAAGRLAASAAAASVASVALAAARPNGSTPVPAEGEDVATVSAPRTREEEEEDAWGRSLSSVLVPRIRKALANFTEFEKRHGLKFEQVGLKKAWVLVPAEAVAEGAALWKALRFETEDAISKFSGDKMRHASAALTTQLLAAEKMDFKARVAKFPLL